MTSSPGPDGIRLAHRWRTRAPAVLLLLLSLTVPLLGQSPSGGNADLDRIRGEIARLKERLDEVHRQARNARQELEAADLELGIHTQELALATQTRQRIDGERTGTEQRIAGLNVRIAQQKGHLRKRLAALYRLGGLSYLRLLMSIDERGDPAAAISMLSFLVWHDWRSIGRFQSTRRDLAAHRAELARQQSQMHGLTRVIAQRQRAVAASHQEKQRLLVRLEKQESGSEQQLAELEEKARRLERLVGTLSAQEPNLPALSDIHAYRGTLGWPVEGKVLEHFGRQRNAKFATYTNNNGLKVSAPPRSTVRAVFQGTVRFSQWFKGYGNLIILDHGYRVFSLYGNIAAPAVSVGERVATGQTMAAVGEGEEPGSGYLYFEIRQDNHPEDPQKWLR